MRAVLTAAVVVASLGLLGCGASRALIGVAAAEAQVTLAVDGAAATAEGFARAERVAAAQAAIRSALPDGRSASLARTSFLAAARAGDVAAGSRIQAEWLPPSDDPKVVLALVDLSVAAGAYDAARSQAWAAAERFPELRRVFVDAWLGTWTADPVFAPEIATLDVGGPIDHIRPLGGGSSLTYRLDADGMTLAAFKPNQTRLQSNFRAEIAAYRLCALIFCRFEVPHNRELRISREAWYALSGADDAAAQRALDRQGRDLVWTTDAEGREWLHGTAKSWVLSFRLFGIERSAAWADLVSLEGASDIDVDDRMRGLLSGRAAGTLDGLSSDALARQLSNLHVFDYLLNNWDRYSSRFPGVNCQWRDDHFVSIDNGAAFPLRRYQGVTSQRVARNLSRIEVFSRRTIDAIRWMDTDAMFGLLFRPSPAADAEKERYATFLLRRAALLAYVDGLIADHGEEAVLAFP
ncbi:MAG: hypothetical protein H6698_04275 [Myxococcales bacterium]|nr:hypothetical protein [Myxococcales bacterium]MCB9532436.1 hypothetical protein [Myxococcales bacterium]MCB9533518.1 hypothetical protein [Myxococcales bacterium]